MTNLPAMTLKAEIVIEIEAHDFLDAAKHQKSVQEQYELIKQIYPNAVFNFRPLRRTIPRVKKRRLPIYERVGVS